VKISDVKRGQRVRVVRSWRGSFRQQESEYGVIVRVLPGAPPMLIVKRDKIKQHETWHPSYWNPVR
jgi:hypothetical protein